MILNTGCRTDIPAYFSNWFYQRIKEGYVLVRNPYYPEQVSRYVLTPDVVDLLSFCTKNPEPMLTRLDEISQFCQFWYVTITPYGKKIEPFVPDKRKVMESFKRLSNIVGITNIGWRYDPIFLSDIYTVEFHLQKFEEMAANLSGYVDYCVISFIDLYEKTKRNFPGVKEVCREDRLHIGEEFAKIGAKYGIRIRSCCEGTELARFGIDTEGCFTRKIAERAVGSELNLPKRKSTAREACDCLLGSDIGMYNTCGHGCVYCYANYDKATVSANRKLHDPMSPFLIGNKKPEDTIKEAKQISYATGQMMLELY